MNTNNYYKESRNWTIPPELSERDLLPEDTFEGYFLSKHDGAKICFAFYIPPNATGNAVVIEQGTSEHIGKYADTFHDLAERGISIFMAEPRGQGMSQRKDPANPAHMSAWNFLTYARDSRQMLTDVVRPVMASHGFSYPNLTGLGVSQGAARTLHTEYHYPGSYNQIVLGSPMIHQYDMVRLHRNMEKHPERTMWYLQKHFGVATLKDTIDSNFERDSLLYINNPANMEPAALWHRYNGPDDAVCLRANRVTLEFIQYGGAACLDMQNPIFSGSLRTPILTITSEEKLGAWQFWRWGDKCVGNAETETFMRNVQNGAMVAMRGTEHDMLKFDPALRDVIFDLVCDEFVADPHGFIERNNIQEHGVTRVFYTATDPLNVLNLSPKNVHSSATDQSQPDVATPFQPTPLFPAPEHVSA